MQADTRTGWEPPTNEALLASEVIPANEEPLTNEAIPANGALPANATPRPTPVASLVAVLERMVEPGGLDDLDESGLLEVAAAFARVESFGAAGVRAAAGALAARVSVQDRCIAAAADLSITGLVADEVAIRLGVSRTKAARLVSEGRALAGVLCAVGDALVDGEIDAGKAALFVERLADQSDIVALAVCDLVLPDAPTLSHHALGRAIDRALIGVDPDGSQARHLAANARRRVTIRRTSEGMAVLSLHAPVGEVALIDATLERIARAARAQGDPRSLDQLRADSLVSAVEAVVTAGEVTLRPEPQWAPKGAVAPLPVAEEPVAPLPVTEPAPAHSRVAFRTTGLLTLRQPPAGDAGITNPHPSLARIYEAELCGGGPTAAGEEPECDCGGLNLDDIAATPSHELAAPVAELIGVGPLPPGVADALTANPPRWLRITQRNDPAAEPPSTVPGYRPTAALARWVRERDEHCVAPGCAVPASRCDLDHLVPYPQGPTSADNLFALCRHHHLIKTHARHRLGKDLVPNGAAVLTWTTRLGQTLRRDPATRQWERASSGSRPAQPP